MTTLRSARPGEAELLTGLAIRSKAFWGYDEDFMRACVPALTLTEQKIASGGVFVAERAGRIEGFVAITCEDGAAEVDMMFVEPGAVQGGVGKALMAQAEAAARDAQAERLWVLSDPNAVGFYEACGLVRVGDAPSDAVAGRRLPVLEKRLNTRVKA